MIYAVVYLFGTGICMKAAETRQGFNRKALHLFSAAWLTCGLLACAGLVGVL